MVSKIKLVLLSLVLLSTVGCATLTDPNFWKGDAGTLAVLVIIDQQDTPEKRIAKAMEYKVIAQEILSVLDGVPGNTPNLKNYIFSVLSVDDKPISQQFVYGKLVDAVLAEADVPEGVVPNIEDIKDILINLINILSQYETQVTVV